MALTRSILAAAVICLLGTQNVAPSTLSDLLATPDNYNQKRITVEGILRGGGEGYVFEMYNTIAEALTMSPWKGIFVVAPKSWNDCACDLRRAQVTGVVNSKHHMINAYRCVLEAEQMKLLSDDPVAPWPDPIAVFRNETGKRLFLVFADSEGETAYTAEPKKCTPVSFLREGTVRALSMKTDDTPGRVMAKAIGFVTRPSSPYFDPKNQAAYYRVTGDRIEKVLPTAARSWGWRR